MVTILAQQELIFQGPRDPAYFEEPSILIWWIAAAVILVISALIIWWIKRPKDQLLATPIPSKLRDLHNWDQLIIYWQQAAEQEPYPLDLMIALLKQASYLATHQQPQQAQLDIWLNLTPQELTHELTGLCEQQPHLTATFNIKEYLQKLNYLEHIRFNPQFINLPQKQLLQPTIQECLTLLKQVDIIQQPSSKDNAN